MQFKITFHLDGSGVMYDPNEPIHLDGLLAWVLAPHQNLRHLTRDDVPDDVRLPIVEYDTGHGVVYRASALLPEGPTSESLQFWRKRFRSGRIEQTSGAPNLTNGIYRDWNNPIPLMLATRLVAWASGDRKEVKRKFRELKYLGKKRAHGWGKILDIEYSDALEEDWSLSRPDENGGRIAQRYLPDPNGIRLVRLRPPYWNIHGRVNCCEVGDATTIK